MLVLTVLMAGMSVSTAHAELSPERLLAAAFDGPAAGEAQTGAAGEPQRTGWTPVYRSGLNGEALYGSKDSLLNAIRAGHPVRVGWGVKIVSDSGIRSVEHTADPVFLTITNGTDVVAQLPEHIAQRSYWDIDQALFDRGSVMWRGVVSTAGSFDALWVDRATGETVQRFPQRAVFTWFVNAPPDEAAPELAIERGVIADASRKND